MTLLIVDASTLRGELHLGWLGVQLPGIEDEELSAICREAFATVAPPSVLRMWRPESGE
jgi:hypothetical protein